MVGQSRRGRVRSEYEDLDEEMFNTWPSKHNDASADVSYAGKPQLRVIDVVDLI